jgi:hypothetical protein
MTVDQILELAVASLKKAMPEAIYQGSLVKKTRAFDASSSVARLVDTDVTPVEIVFDSLSSEEINGTTIKTSDLKLIIIANAVKTIDFYDAVRVNGNDYKISKKIETIVGSKNALFTIIASV